VAGDNLAAGTWQGPSDFKLMDRSFEQVYDAVIEVLAKSI
jgi:hypothetical protein